MSLLEGIVEVRQVDAVLANRLLDKGYKLLHVESTAKGIERQNDPTKGLGANFFVSKKIEYVIGRTADQPSMLDLLLEGEHNWQPCSANDYGDEEAARYAESLRLYGDEARLAGEHPL